MTMEMEVDFEHMDVDSPPSSPIIGSGLKSLGSSRKIAFEVQQYGCCFVCQGPSRSTTEELSSEGLLRNGEINEATSLLSLTSAAEGFLRNNIDDGSKFDKIEGKFFGFPFSNDEETLNVFIKMCRKQIATVEILVVQPNLSALLGHRSENPSFDDDPSKILAWELRKDVCVFLNAMAKGLPFVTCFEAVKPMELFKGLLDSIEPIEQSPRLRSYTGCSDGNRSTSSLHHYFHLHLEVRWYSVILSLMNPTVVETVLVDLIQLAWYRFQPHERAADVSKQTAFNCCCVKELWVMLLHLIAKYKPAGWDFWDAVKATMRNCDKIKDNTDFQVWLILQLAPMYKYNSSGQNINYSELLPNCYPYIAELLRAENIKPVTIDSVLRLATKLIPLWGPDERLAKAAREYWQAKIDKPISGLQNTNYWKSSDNWLALLASINSDDMSSAETSSSSFNIFLKFFSTMVQACTNPKRIQRLITPLFVNMPSNKIGSFTETGMIRLMTFYLAICNSQDVHSVHGTVVKWFNVAEQLFVVYKTGGKWNLVRTLLVAQSSALLILLRRGVNVQSVAEQYMKQISDLIAGGSNVQAPGQKDAVMAYIEMLSLVPTYSKEEDLSQETLLSVHLTMWCSGCSADCLSRTFRALEILLTWQNCSCSVPNLGKTVYATTKYLISSVLKESRITFTSNDTNTISQLGTSLCVYANREHKDHLQQIFRLFTLGENSTPEISKAFVDKVFQLENPISFEYLDMSHAWIRLLAYEILPPFSMTTYVFSDNIQTLTESCRDLVPIYCDLVNKEDWTLEKVTEVLKPFTRLCEKLHMPAPPELLKHRIHMSLIILQRMNPSAIYGVRVACPAKCMINGILLMTTHVNQQTTAILKAALPELFQAVQRLSSIFSDEYLKARSDQILTMTATNFTTGNQLSAPEQHPLFKIVTTAYAANKMNSLHTMGDLQKLSQGKRYSDYLKTLQQLGRHPRFTPGIIYSLPMVLKIVRESGSNTDIETCASILSNIFRMESIPLDLVEEIKRAIRAEMREKMALHWRKYMSLFNTIAKRTGPTAQNIRRNVRDIVLEELRERVHDAEATRGSGVNACLRTELQKFETALGLMPTPQTAS